ncbi:hypothetical protein HDU76_008022 [Blyttiomyces sp. JEL0837]|nr:hypothetical protein HDU76_008022 [Blyttiomyces sp. JEL0837]
MRRTKRNIVTKTQPTVKSKSAIDTVPSEIIINILWYIDFSNDVVKTLRLVSKQFYTAISLIPKCINIKVKVTSFSDRSFKYVGYILPPEIFKIKEPGFVSSCEWVSDVMTSGNPINHERSRTWYLSIASGSIVVNKSAIPGNPTQFIAYLKEVCNMQVFKDPIPTPIAVLFSSVKLDTHTHNKMNESEAAAVTKFMCLLRAKVGEEIMTPWNSLFATEINYNVDKLTLVIDYSESFKNFSTLKPLAENIHTLALKRVTNATSSNSNSNSKISFRGIESLTHLRALVFDGDDIVQDLVAKLKKQKMPPNLKEIHFNQQQPKFNITDFPFIASQAPSLSYIKHLEVDNGDCFLSTDATLLKAGATLQTLGLEFTRLDPTDLLLLAIEGIPRIFPNLKYLDIALVAWDACVYDYDLEVKISADQFIRFVSLLKLRAPRLINLNLKISDEFTYGTGGFLDRYVSPVQNLVQGSKLRVTFNE